MSSEYTVSRYLADRLKQAGISHIFGVPGDYAFPFLDEIEAHPDIVWVGACNELNAAYAADGYARISGMSAITGSCGVLEMGAAGGIAGAFTEEVALLVISGFPATDDMMRRNLTHHSIRGSFEQHKMLMAPITTAQVMLTATDACKQIDHALRTCWLEKSPVYVQFPLDVQTLRAKPPASPLVLREPKSNTDALDRFLAQVLPILRSAKHPAMLVDYPISRHGITDLVESLSAAADIPFASTLSGRSGSINQTHSRYIGYYMAPPRASENSQVIDNADALIRVCLRHDETNRGHADPALTAPHLIDLQADRVSVGGVVHTGVTARDALDRLRAELASGKTTTMSKPIPAPDVFEPRVGASITQDRLWQAFAGFLKADDTIAIDYGTAQVIKQLTFPVRTRMLFQTNWTAIGYTTPAILGAMLADSAGRYIYVVGDGAFQETAQEITTIMRFGLSPITILLHNTTYEIENATHEDAPVDKRYNAVPSWDYSKLPAIMSPTTNPMSVRVETEEQLAWALDEATTAQRDGRYSFIEVMLPPNDVASVMSDYLGLST